MKKITAILLALALLLCLSACAESRIESYSDEEIAAATEAAEAAEEAAAPHNAFPADTVVATINGSAITWDEYFYWLDNYRMSVENSFGAITDWAALNAYYSSNTNEEVVRTLAQEDALYYHLVLAEAEARGITPEPSTVQEQMLLNIDQTIGNADGTLSAEEETLFDQQLADAGVSRDLYTLIIQEMLSLDALYENSTAAFTEADALAWGEEQEFMNAKHILLLTVDSATREALSEEEIAAAKEKTEALYAELSEAYVPAKGDNAAFLELFDELMIANSEDTGLATSPDGYVFQPGQMVEAFETAVKALDENYEMSGVVESEYGYHIILRQPLEADSSLGQNVYGQSVTLIDEAKSQAFNAELSALYAAAEIEWTEGFDTLSMAELFG